MSNPELDPSQRIVVTGIGIVSPLGNGSHQNWQALMQGMNAVTSLPAKLQFDAYAERTSTVAEATQFSPTYLEEMTGLKAKDVRRRHRCTLLALAAGAEAVQQAGLAEIGSIALIGTEESKSRKGVVVGSGAAGADMFAKSKERLLVGKMTDLVTGMQALTQDPATYMARATGAKGCSVMNSGACNTGNMSIQIGIDKILNRRNNIDVMLVGSTEAQTTPEAFNIFAPMTALDPNPDPANASRPFHIDREGFVMAEGSGMLVIERLSHALGRNATILAEITGWGESNDGLLKEETRPSGEGSYLALKDTLSTVRDYDLAYVNAHATATIEGDPVEMNAIRRLMDPAKTIVTSTKANLGHGLGGAASMEAVITALVVMHNQVPPQIKVDDNSMIPEANGFVRPSGALPKGKIELGINNSFGFGGGNNIIAFQSYED